MMHTGVLDVGVGRLSKLKKLSARQAATVRTARSYFFDNVRTVRVFHSGR